MKILVVDDNRINLKVAVAQLGESHEVSTASSYENAQELMGFSYMNGRSACTFDVVLTDLFMPGPRKMNHGPSEEMPVGTFLAILAAKNGAQYVGLLTDTDHHSHPASECIDAIEGHEASPDSFRVENAKVVFANTRNWIREFDPNNLSTPLKYSDAKNCEGRVRAKDWKSLLAHLVKD